MTVSISTTDSTRSSNALYVRPDTARLIQAQGSLIVMRSTVSKLLARSPASWRWALIVVFSGAVILGLLGMHTLSTAHTGIADLSSAAAMHEHSPTEVSSPSNADHGQCVDCGSGEHDALMFACLLVLLVTSLLLIRSPHQAGRTSHSAFFAGPPAPGPIVPPRPPSLLELSISRT